MTLYFNFLITGASGYLGSELMRQAQKKGLSYMGIGRRKDKMKNYRVLDLTSKTEVQDFREKFKFKTLQPNQILRKAF